MARNDRTLISGLLLPHFPALKNATSQEWHDFLNGVTGLALPDDMPNGEAFDKWRQVLSVGLGLPVWSMTEADVAEKKNRAKKMLDRENKRRAKDGETLLKLKNEAPGEAVPQ